MLDEFPGHGTVAGEQVGHAGAEDRVEEAEQDSVPSSIHPAKLASAPRAEPGADDDVRRAVENGLDHPSRLLRRVGIVPIHQQVDVGLDLSERLPHGEALAGPRFPEDDGSMLRRHLRRLVR